MNYTEINPTLNFELLHLNLWQKYSIVSVLVVLIFLCDIATGPDVPLNLYHVIPVLLSTWLLDRRFTYLIIVLASLLDAYALSGIFQDGSPHYFIYNLVQEIFAFSFIEIGLIKFRQKYIGITEYATYLKLEFEKISQQNNSTTSIRQALLEDIKDKPKIEFVEKKKPLDQSLVQGETIEAPADRLEGLLGNEPSHQEMAALVAIFNGGKYTESAVLARTMTERFPLHGFSWKILGVTFIQMGRHEDALAALQQAVVLSPSDPEAHNNMGVTLMGMSRLSEAEACYRKALQIKPDFAEAYNNLGLTLQHLGRLTEAEASCRQALQIKPNFAEAYNNLGIPLQYFGRFDEAEASFRCAIQYKPDYFDARCNLALNSKVSANDENLATLAAISKSAQNGKISLQDKDAARLHFALGKSYDDIGDYEKAFPHFIEGCKLKRTTFDYDPAKTEQRFASIMRVFDHTLIDRLRGCGNPSHSPIFIFGMPRSGTTLIEQIIASHPEVQGAGELPYLMDIAQREIAGAIFPENLGLLDQARLTTWGAEYVARCQQWVRGKPLFTDKMPENFLVTGLIHLILPNAKVIHINRNPVDTCLSCFTTLFKSGNEYTYDLAELGRYYVGYVRLMEHWRKLLPADAFLDVQYENVVQNQEVQSRRIIEYCGLEWHDACLGFHKNQRPVITASMKQVRQPIYKSSIERWRHYEKFLGPLLNALGELAPAKKL